MNVRPKRRLGAAAAALLLLGGIVGSQGGALSHPGPDERPVARRAGTTPVGPARATSEWRSETITTSTGETVRLEVSEAYTDPAFAQAWGEFFGGLVHGTELGQVTVRIVTPAELPASCGPRALGCYTSGMIVIPGEQAGGVEAAEIARHEYGHHVAATRQNPPWNASTWGAKRWATQAEICSRAAGGEIEPDSYENYELSPREAFAEVYRVLNDRRAGVTGLAWSIVDEKLHPRRRGTPRRRRGRDEAMGRRDDHDGRREIQARRPSSVDARDRDAARRHADGRAPAACRAYRPPRAPRRRREGAGARSLVGDIGQAARVRRLRAAVAPRACDARRRSRSVRALDRSPVARRVRASSIDAWRASPTR